MVITASQSLWAGQMRMAQMNAAGVNLLCGVPSAPLSADAKAALRDLSILLGKDVGGQNTPDMQHCQDCVMANYDLITPTIHAHIVQKNILSIQRDAIKPTQFTQSCEGPPLGSRAPPLSA